MKFLKEAGTTLQQCIVRKHGRTKAVRNTHNDKHKNNKHKFTKRKLDPRINLRRQQKNKQLFTLNGNISIPVDLREYDHSFESVTDTLRLNTIITYSHNRNNILQYATTISSSRKIELSTEF